MRNIKSYKLFNEKYEVEIINNGGKFDMNIVMDIRDILLDLEDDNIPSKIYMDNHFLEIDINHEGRDISDVVIRLEEFSKINNLKFENFIINRDCPVLGKYSVYKIGSQYIKNIFEAWSSNTKIVLIGQESGFDNDDHILCDLKDILIELEDDGLSCRIWINRFRDGEPKKIDPKLLTIEIQITYGKMGMFDGREMLIPIELDSEHIIIIEDVYLRIKEYLSIYGFTEPYLKPSGHFTDGNKYHYSRFARK